jgi:hypothetical protein
MWPWEAKDVNKGFDIIEKQKRIFPLTFDKHTSSQGSQGAEGAQETNDLAHGTAEKPRDQVTKLPSSLAALRVLVFKGR